MLAHRSIRVSDDVGVLLELRKLIPLIVTGKPALLAKFALSIELTLTNGAAHSSQPIIAPHMTRSHGRSKAWIPSKLNCPVKVPTTAFKLTAIRIDEPVYADGAHATAVADVHAVLLHESAAPSETVGVKTELPKFSPPIVTDPPAVTPMFSGLLTLAHGAATGHTMRAASSDVRLGYRSTNGTGTEADRGTGRAVSRRQFATPCVRTVEAELPRQCARHSTHTHRRSHRRRASIGLRRAHHSRRRRPCAAAASVRRSQRGGRRRAGSAEA